MSHLKVSRGGAHAAPAGEADAAVVQALWLHGGLRRQLQAALEHDVFDSDDAADDSVASSRACCARANPCCLACWLHPQCWGACRICFFSQLPECRGCRSVTWCDLLSRYLKFQPEGRAKRDPDGLFQRCVNFWAPAWLGVNTGDGGERVVRLSREARFDIPGYRVSVRGHRVGLTATGQGLPGATGHPKQP